MLTAKLLSFSISLFATSTTFGSKSGFLAGISEVFFKLPETA
jgi:hypothetical protein